MKNVVLATLDRVSADLREAIGALQKDDTSTALEKLESISKRLREKAAELRR